MHLSIEIPSPHSSPRHRVGFFPSISQANVFPFTPENFAGKFLLKLVDPFSGHYLTLDYFQNLILALSRGQSRSNSQASVESYAVGFAIVTCHAIHQPKNDR